MARPKKIRIVLPDMAYMVGEAVIPAGEVIELDDTPEAKAEANRLKKKYGAVTAEKWRAMNKADELDELDEAEEPEADAGKE